MFFTVNVLPVIAAPANPPVDQDTTQGNTDSEMAEQQSSEVSSLENMGRK